MSKIYYAHSKLIYGTDTEASAIAYLKQQGFEVLCPHNDLGELGSIQPYLQAIDTCEAVIIHPYKGFIGRGVFEELKHTLCNNKSASVLCYNIVTGYSLHPVKGYKLHDQMDWKFKYGKVLY